MSYLYFIEDCAKFCASRLLAHFIATIWSFFYVMLAAGLVA